MARKTDKPLSNIAVIYARFSSHNQREESIEQQVAECKVFAAQQGLEVTEIYSDAAQSGRTENRSQFLRLQRDAKKGKFTNIVAYKSNRIARNMVNALTFENDMEKLGVKLYYAKEEFGNNAAGRFALRMMMNVNQFYSENMAEDIRRGMEDNAMKCKVNGPAPYGYKSGKSGTYEIDEPAAAVVREIFTRVACGDSFVDIYTDLNNRGLKTRKGNKWGRSSFQSILKCEKYTGVYIYDNIRVEGGMPEIISKEMFLKVQRILGTKGNPQGRHRINGDYLLTGKLFCGECGHHMMGLSGTGKNGLLHYYYGCSGKKEKPRCSKKNVRRDELEYEVARLVQTYILQDDVITWLADTLIKYQEEHSSDGDMTILNTQLSETEKSIKNLMAAIEQGIITPSTKERLMELESEKSKIENNITLLKADTITVSKEQIGGWLDSFRDGNIKDKRFQKRLFDSFLSAVYVYDDNRVRIVFNLCGLNKGDIDTKLILGDTEAIEKVSDCSYKRCYGSPDLIKGEHSFSWVFVFLSLELMAPSVFSESLSTEKSTHRSPSL